MYVILNIHPFYMIVDLTTTKYYFLTCDPSGVKKHHIMDCFKDYDITEVNPILGIHKFKSAPIGFSRMIDLGLRRQDRSLPFQPFVLLEDDISFYRPFPNTITVPNDSDLVYIGLSKCGTHPKTEWANHVFMKDVDDGTVRIFNMFSCHGIMVCSAAGASALQKCMMEGYFQNKVWDLYTAAIQPYYNVYALKIPLVYQDVAFGGKEPETKIELSLIDNSDLPVEYLKDYVSVKTCQKDSSV